MPLVLLPVRLERQVLGAARGLGPRGRVFPTRSTATPTSASSSGPSRPQGRPSGRAPPASARPRGSSCPRCSAPSAAAWVAEATRPGDPGPPPPRLRASPGPPGRSALPDRFLFSSPPTARTAMLEGERVRSAAGDRTGPAPGPDADDGTDAGHALDDGLRPQAVTEGMGARRSAPRRERIDQVLASECGRASASEPPICSAGCWTRPSLRRRPRGPPRRTPSDAGGGAPAARAQAGGDARARRPQIAAGADGAGSRALGVAPNGSPARRRDATSEAERRDADGALAGHVAATSAADARGQRRASSRPRLLARPCRQLGARPRPARAFGPAAPPTACSGDEPRPAYAPDPGDPPEAGRLSPCAGVAAPWADAAGRCRRPAARRPRMRAETLPRRSSASRRQRRRRRAPHALPEGVVDILTGLGGMTEDPEVSLRTILAPGSVAEGMKSLGASVPRRADARRRRQRTPPRWGSLECRLAALSADRAARG